MWKKEGKIFIDPLRYDGKMIFNPTEEMLKKAGFEWVETETVPDAPVPEVPKRYSTLKIIRALGDDWQSYKNKLEAAGVLDQFFAANFLRSDDQFFIEFIKDVPEELKNKLDTECLWEH